MVFRTVAAGRYGASSGVIVNAAPIAGAFSPDGAFLASGAEPNAGFPVSRVIRGHCFRHWRLVGMRQKP